MHESRIAEVCRKGDQVANSYGFDSSTAYRLIPGRIADSPILLAIPGKHAELASMIDFCQRICPGAPLLVADLQRVHKDTSAGGKPFCGLVVDRLAAIITEAIQTHDLSLIPIVAVGNAKGADLAVYLGLAHGSLLAACILLRPTALAPLVRQGALAGVHVLLVREAAQEAPGTVGWSLHAVLVQAGAEVISERIPDDRSLGSREAAIAHVFIAALFAQGVQ